MQKEDIEYFIKITLKDLLERENLAIPQQFDDSTVIFGHNGLLDSLLLVELMLSMEDFCTQNKLDFIWASDGTFSHQHSIYNTIGSLTQFLFELPKTGENKNE